MYLSDTRAVPPQSSLVPLADPLMSTNEQPLTKIFFCSYIYLLSGLSAV